MRKHPAALTTNLTKQEGAKAIMPVSQRLRYEILKRDSHACHYCGACAPDAKLTVDHVVPTALGGTDEADNLVTACHDCNAGKSSTHPDAETVVAVSEEAERWAAAIQQAAAEALAEHQTDAQRHAWFLDEWRDWDKTCDHLPDGWAKTLDHWLAAGLPQPILVDCLTIAIGNRSISHRNVFAYMGGIARKKIEKLQERAQQIIADHEEADTDGA